MILFHCWRIALKEFIIEFIFIIYLLFYIFLNLYINYYILFIVLLFLLPLFPLFYCFINLSERFTALRAVLVYLCPLKQTYLVEKVTTSRIHIMIVFYFIIQTYRTYIILSLRFCDILKLIIFILFAWSVWIIIWLYNHHLL